MIQSLLSRIPLCLSRPQPEPCKVARRRLYFPVTGFILLGDPILSVSNETFFFHVKLLQTTPMESCRRPRHMMQTIQKLDKYSIMFTFFSYTFSCQNSFAEELLSLVCLYMSAKLFELPASSAQHPPKHPQSFLKALLTQTFDKLPLICPSDVAKIVNKTQQDQ